MKDEPRSADVKAVGPVTCLKLTRKKFLNFLALPLNELLEHNTAHRVLSVQ